MDVISEKTKAKNKKQTLKDSISKLKSDLIIYKSEGNTIAFKAYGRVLNCLEDKLKNFRG
jgi:chaperonin cofactor prefoldin